MTFKWLLCLIPSLLCAQTRTKPRERLLVVVDPGHGGTDPGSFRVVRGDTIFENQYVYDVGLRVMRLVREAGGLAFSTVLRDVGERGQTASEIMPDDRDAVFALDNTKVSASKTGLEKRVAYGNKLGQKYPKYHQVWISIHFDVVGKDSDIEGVRIIAADTGSSFTHSLAKSLSDVHRLREKDPIVGNGDSNHGIRHLVVLGKTNRTKDRVLVELGNFNNDRDVYRLRDPKVREKYAQAIVKALKKF